MPEFIIIPEPVLTDEANVAFYVQDAKNWDQAIWTAAHGFELADGDYRVIKFGDKADQAFSVEQHIIEWNVQRKIGDAD